MSVGAAPARRHRVLLFAEAVTLAHVARPHVLASGLAPQRYEVCLAKDERYDPLLGPVPYTSRHIDSIPTERFLHALARGRPVYRVQDLEHYVEQDLAIIKSFQPDVIVGDFRLSLSVSARLASRPYVAIANAYWSPHARPRYLVPDLPFLRWLGRGLGQAVFDLVRPLAFAMHGQPLNRVRRRHGLPSLGRDLRRTYTDADYVLYADLPELVPTYEAPPSHRYLGPVVWEPALPLPDWWASLSDEYATIFVSLGSSGPAAVLPRLLEQLSTLPVTVLAATAGRVPPGRCPSGGRIHMADYLPAVQAIARSQLVICNGGSPMSQLALCAGRPVLGMPGNLDQLLNMHYVRTYGAGEILHTDGVDKASTRHLVMAMLEPGGRWAHAARRAQSACSACDAVASFTGVIEDILH